MSDGVKTVSQVEKVQVRWKKYESGGKGASQVEKVRVRWKRYESCSWYDASQVEKAVSQEV